MRSVRAPRAADDDRHRSDRPRVTGRLGQLHPLAGVRLGARRQQRPDRLHRGLEQVQPLRPAAANGSPKAACSRSHQPAPRPRKARPPLRASRVATVLAVMPAGRKRHRRDERAQPQAGVEAGQQPEGHPRLRDRLPGAAHRRDLDEVIHQGQAGEARRCRRPARPRAASRPDPRRRRSATPAGRSRGRSGRSAVAATPRAADRLRRTSAATATIASQPSAASSSAHRGGAAQLRGEGGRGDGPVAAGVAFAHERRRCGEADGHRGESVRARQREVAAPPLGVEARGCRSRRSARAGRARRRCRRAAGRRRWWRRGRGGRCRRCRAGRRRRRSRRRGSAAPPTSTCRRRPARRARPGPGPGCRWPRPKSGTRPPPAPVTEI